MPIIHIDDSDTNDLQKCVNYVVNDIAEQQRRDGSDHGLGDAGNMHVHASHENAFSMRSHTTVIFGSGGRLDQEMCNLNTLYQNQKHSVMSPHTSLWARASRESIGLKQHQEQQQQQYNIYNTAYYNRFVIVSPFSAGFVLVGGPHIRHCIQLDERFEKRTCGLVPLGTRCDSVTTSGLQWDLNDDKMEFGGMISSSNRILESECVIQCSNDLLYISTLRPDIW